MKNFSFATRTSHSETTAKSRQEKECDSPAKQKEPKKMSGSRSRRNFWLVSPREILVDVSFSPCAVRLH